MASETLREAHTKMLGEITPFALKALPLFQANNWTWGKDGVPTQLMLEGCIDRMGWEAYKEADKNGVASCCSTGRLQVRFVKYERGWVGAIELTAIWTNIE